MQQPAAQSQQHQQHQQQVQPVMTRQLSFSGFRAAGAGPKAGVSLEEGAAVPARSFWRLGQRGEDSPSKGGAHPVTVTSTASIDSGREEESPGKSTAPPTGRSSLCSTRLGIEARGWKWKADQGWLCTGAPRARGCLQPRVRSSRCAVGEAKAWGEMPWGCWASPGRESWQRPRPGGGLPLGEHKHALGAPVEGQHVQVAPVEMDLQAIKENLGVGAGPMLPPGNALVEAARKVHQGSKGPGKGQGNEGAAAAHPGAL